MKFIPLLKMPEKGDPYYNTKSVGGYSPCKVGKPTVEGLNVLANCVGYGVGRFNAESCEGKINFLTSMNAENLFPMSYKWNLKVGLIPKLGAMICWSGGKEADPSDGKGHVAIVEEIYSESDILVSESAYNGYKWRNRRINNSNGNWGANSKYKFQGFIYNPNIDDYSAIETLLNEAIDKISEAKILLEKS